MKKEYSSPVIELIPIENILTASPWDDNELPGTNPFEDW